MEFYLDKNSTIPIIKQIQEQIKLSIAMGVLKRDDILPTIREVEKQTGINRGQVHRAYLALHQSGLASVRPSFSDFRQENSRGRIRSRFGFRQQKMSGTDPGDNKTNPEDRSVPDRFYKVSQPASTGRGAQVSVYCICRFG